MNDDPSPIHLPITMEDRTSSAARLLPLNRRRERLSEKDDGRYSFPAYIRDASGAVAVRYR